MPSGPVRVPELEVEAEKEELKEKVPVPVVAVALDWEENGFMVVIVICFVLGCVGGVRQQLVGQVSVCFAAEMWVLRGYKVD
jgi:hypothetical protein